MSFAYLNALLAMSLITLIKTIIFKFFNCYIIALVNS